MNNAPSVGGTPKQCLDYLPIQDRPLLDGAEQPRIMGIAVHPHLSSVPHRIKYFKQAFAYLKQQPGALFWTGEQILDWHLSQMNARTA